MSAWRKKPVVIEATQWFKDGDHPNVVAIPHQVFDTIESRTTAVGIDECRWIGTLEGGHIVSPGDWIITGVQGEQYPCKPDIFAATYEPVSEPPSSNLLPHQQRVVIEKAELDEKLTKLLAFFQTPIFAGLSEVERSRLRKQARFMDGYAAVLEERIVAFSTE